MKGKQKTILTFALAAALTVMPFRAHAAIPVIDDSNIMQQIKTYMETIKVVTNTAEQIKMQIKELESLPKQILDRYKKEFVTAIEEVKAHTKMTGMLDDVKKLPEVWGHCFPTLRGGDLSHTATSEKNMTVTMQEVLSMRNQQDVAAYRALMQDLQKSKDKLAELLELNKTPEGQKQGKQLANEIAAEKAHIDSINTSIQAISVQNEAMKNQMEVVKAQNQQAVADAMAQATEQTIDDMYNKANAAGRIGETLDDPFARNGLGW